MLLMQANSFYHDENQEYLRLRIEYTVEYDSI